jgi:hypothetical protein
MERFSGISLGTAYHSELDGWIPQSVEDRSEYSRQVWASPHISLWTRDTIEAYCDYLVETYASRTEDYTQMVEEYERERAVGRRSGVSDMTTLGLFAVSVSSSHGSLIEVQAGTAHTLHICDLRFKQGDEGVYREWRDGIPYGRSMNNGEEVRFLSLHCQGRYKVLMEPLRSKDSCGRRGVPSYRYLYPRLVTSMRALSATGPRRLKRGLRKVVPRWS